VTQVEVRISSYAVAKRSVRQKLVLRGFLFCITKKMALSLLWQDTFQKEKNQNG